MVESTTREPDPDRELKDQQIQYSDVRGLVAVPAQHGERPAVGERIARRSEEAVGFCPGSREEGALAHRQRDR
jgi:hypothetical protein